MTITNVRTAINAEQHCNIEVLNFKRQFDQPTEAQVAEAVKANPAVDVAKVLGNPQPWVSHWEDSKRIRVAMHDDVLTALKADKELSTLAFKSEVVHPDIETAKYIRYILFIPRHIELSIS
jgi:hypothetical protein